MTTPTQISQNAAGASATLYVATAGWVIAGIFLGAKIWDSDGPATGISNNPTAITIIVLCLIGASLSFAGGAIVRELGKRA